MSGASIRQKSGAARFVKPVGQEPDAVSALDLEVLAVGFGNIGGGQALQVVTIEKNGHPSPPRPLEVGYAH